MTSPHPEKSSNTTNSARSPCFPCQNLKFMLQSDQVSSHKKSLRRLTTEKRVTQKFCLTDVDLHKVFCLCLVHFMHFVFDSNLQRELLITVSGIYSSSPQINSTLQTCFALRQWQVYESVQVWKSKSCHKQKGGKFDMNSGSASISSPQLTIKI